MKAMILLLLKTLSKLTKDRRIETSSRHLILIVKITKLKEQGRINKEFLAKNTFQHKESIKLRRVGGSMPRLNQPNKTARLSSTNIDSSAIDSITPFDLKAIKERVLASSKPVSSFKNSQATDSYADNSLQHKGFKNSYLARLQMAQSALGGVKKLSPRLEEFCSSKRDQISSILTFNDENRKIVEYSEGIRIKLTQPSFENIHSDYQIYPSQTISHENTDSHNVSVFAYYL